MLPIHSLPPRRLLAAALLTALAPPDAQAGDDGIARKLDTVQVTATHTPLTVADSLAAVEVIDRDAIARSPARSLPELLRGRPGITLVNQGGLGKLSSLFLRGTESDHTLILVDGVRIGSTTAGLTALQDIPLAQIERIEIVRGPRSSLYGADAIGGVIQIFTRRLPGQAGVQGRASLGAGSHGLREASAGLDLRGARGGLGLELAHQRTDGINACSGYFNPQTWQGAGCFIVPGTHTDRDGYRNTSVGLRADFAPDEAWLLQLHGLRASGHNDYDGDYSDNDDYRQQVVGGRLRWAPREGTSVQLSLGRNQDDTTNFLGHAFSSRIDSTRDSASLQGETRLAPGQAVTAGIDWLRDRAQVRDPYSPFAARRGNRGAFVQYLGQFAAQELQASLRHDDNDQFGGKTTGSLAWGWAFAPGWRLAASHGTAFKTPTFNELYYPYYGNPGLRPESSRSNELSLRRIAADWEVQLNAYQTVIDDLIAYDSRLFATNNLDQARIRGLELTGRLQLRDWTVHGALGWLDARNRSRGAYFDHRLPRRPPRSARLDLDRRLGDWSLGLTAIAEAARWDDVANTLRVGGYATVDARADWQFAPAWRLQASVINLFDRRYQTAAYYNQPGREFALRLHWQPR